MLLPLALIPAGYLNTCLAYERYNRGRIGDPPLLLRRDEHRTWKGHRTKNEIFTKNEITKNEMENQIFIRCSLVREISVRKKIFFGNFSNLKKNPLKKNRRKKSVAKKKIDGRKEFSQN